MGGLLAADATIQIQSQKYTQNYMDTDDFTNISATAALNTLNIRGILAIDSPFCGLHPNIFKNESEKVVKTAERVTTSIFGYTNPPASTSKSTGTSKPTNSGGSFGLVSGLFAVAAVAGIAAAASNSQTVRSFVAEKVDKAAKHLEFLGPLWTIEGQQDRLISIGKLQNAGMKFKTLYLKLSNTETFILVPPAPYTMHFSPIEFTGTEPVESHKHMFEPERYPTSYVQILTEASRFCSEVDLGNDPQISTRSEQNFAFW
ncbi:hypothetical protein HK098_005447 [Nowakowskiella sp. JEL0407]|nr:hypothetical protein HK098_005447 [Nowakowskiella sp. JEL0407]